MEPLPPELACDILSYLDWNSLLSVSHVYRAWRATALADQSLWCKPSFQTEAVFRDCDDILSRSRQRPLNLTVDLSSSSRNAALALLLTASHIWDGLRGLQVTFEEELLNGIVEWMRRQRAPILRDLSLVLDG